jgi:hypothetical protein
LLLLRVPDIQLHALVVHVSEFRSASAARHVCHSVLLHVNDQQNLGSLVSPLCWIIVLQACVQVCHSLLFSAGSQTGLKSRTSNTDVALHRLHETVILELKNGNEYL